MEIKLLHTDFIVEGPVYPFFLRQIANLMEDKHTWYVKTWNEDTLGAIYATYNNKVVGHIAYEYKEFNNSLWIVLSAVDTGYRGMGIYKQMHSKFEELARDKGCSSISSGVHKNNKVRLETAKKVDFVPNEVIMIKKI